MENTNLKWYFPQAENASGRGENDPQKELFPGDIFQTMIRESIQNSLDHPNHDSFYPVRVEYKLHKYATSEFEYFTNDLRNHIQSCYDISNADKFKRMLEVLRSPFFFMLEVSDYNTIGMDYDYKSDKGRFKKFVRYTGDPNDVAGSGGSHGYGKITYFSISEINTIIVSSKTLDGICTFEGVSRLATHPTEKPRWSYYDTGFLDIGDGVPVQEINDIPNIFCRQEPGSTIYIPFANIDDDRNSIEKVFNICCKAVLRNFFAAINDGKLEVLIDFSHGELFGEELIFECSKDTIEDIFSTRFFNNPPYDTSKTSFFDKFNPQPYWLAYKNNDLTITEGMSKEEAQDLCVDKKFICFRRNLSILGKVSLFVNVDMQKGNDLIIFMRCPRMVVGVNHNTLGRGFSAVFLCDDEHKGNKLLRNMEDAAHRTWSKKQLRIDKRPKEMIDQAGRIEDEMKDFIQWCLDVLFPTSQTDSDDIELEDFTVPMISENETTNPLIGSLISIQGNDDSAQGAPVDVHASSVVSQKASKYIGRAQVLEPKKVKNSEEETDLSGGRKRKHHVKPGPDPKPNGEDNYEETLDGEERIVRVKFPVKYRIFTEETSNGQLLYTLIIHSPQQEEKAYLTLTPIGETDDRSCNVNIQTSSIGKVRENELSEVPLNEGKNIISFSVDNSGEYAFTLLAEHDVIIKE